MSSPGQEAASSLLEIAMANSPTSGDGRSATGAPRTQKVLVAGIGNIFLGDDGFGVEVVRRLEGKPMPEGVRVIDFGIRGIHLAYELMNGYDTLVLVDALPRGEEPGTVTLFEPEIEIESEETRQPMMDAHGMDPATVLGMLSDLGGKVDRILLVGCEPSTVEEQMGLSEPVAAALDEAVAVVMRLITEASSDAREEGSS
ncbi:MAG: hydrogenase maturation protease [Acidimicrobiales bacterium]